jgi:GxxExxY protein
LAREFDLQNISFEKEKPLPITYKGVNLGTQYRLDFVVDQRVVGELKAVETLLPVHEAQLLPYLKLTPYRIDLLFNFNSKLLTQNMIRRIL